MSLSIQTFCSPSAVPRTGDTTAHLLARLTAAKTQQTTSRQLHISVAMDTSGSMSGSKITMAREALQFLVSQLRPADKLGVISFCSDVEEALPLTTLDVTGAATANAKIQSLNATTSTFLSGGLFASMDQVCGKTFVHPTMSDDQHSARPHMQYQQQQQYAPPPKVNFLAKVKNLFSGVSASASSSAEPSETTPELAIAANTGVTTVDVVVQHEHTTTPDGKHVYKFSVATPAPIASFTLSDKTNARFADIVSEASENVELELLPLDEPLQNVTLTFTVAGRPAHSVDVTLGGLARSTHKLSVPCAAAAPSAQRDDGVTRVVLLFTDGQANVGIQDPEELVAATKRHLAALPHDVSVFTFGFGSDHNASMLQSLATASEGMFYYVENSSAIAEIFADCLGGLLSTAAQGVTLTARLPPGVTFERALTAFKTTTEDDGATVSVTMKDMYAEENRNILLQVRVAPSAVAEGAQVRWEVRYTDATVPNSPPVTAASASVIVVADEAGAPVKEVEEQVQRFLAFEAIGRAKELADKGDVAKAREEALRVRAQIAEAMDFDASPMLQACARQLDVVAEGTRSVGQWAAVGQKQANQYYSSHATERANDATEGMQAYAMTSAKCAMRSKARK